MFHYNYYEWLHLNPYSGHFQLPKHEIKVVGLLKGLYQGLHYKIHKQSPNVHHILSHYKLLKPVLQDFITWLVKFFRN